MPASAPPPVALSALGAGRTGRLHETRLDDQSVGLLRALGLSDAEGLRLCKAGEPCILQVGSTVYVGRGGRTNGEGIRQLRRHVASRGRTVVPVPLHRVLHLKSAITALPDGTIVCSDPALLDTSPLPTLRPVPEDSAAETAGTESATAGASK